MCPHTTIYVSSYYVSSFLDLTQIVPLLPALSTELHIRDYAYPVYSYICVPSYCYICVLILLDMFPHTPRYVSSYSIYVFSYCFICPHTPMYVSSYSYVCVLILLYVSSYHYICVTQYIYAVQSSVLQPLYVSSYCYIYQNTHI